MADLELHADYDRNSRVTATPNEYNRRGTEKAIILPNFDRDDRALPRVVAPSSRIQRDFELDTKVGQDNDLGTLLIKINLATVPVGGNLFVAIFGWNEFRIGLVDQHRRKLRRVPGTFGLYHLPLLPMAGGRALTLRLEARTLGGSPLARLPSVSTSFPQRSETAPLGIDEREFSLQISLQDAHNQVLASDQGKFIIAPYILIDDLSRAERIYICELDDNLPSVADIEQALAGTGLSLIRVPLSVSHGDAWLQDQFQMGYCHGPNNLMLVVWHLPRLRTNVVPVTLGPNLANFVISHFPSRNFGLYDELWQRVIPLEDATGEMQSLPFERSHEVFQFMNRMFILRKKLFWVIRVWGGEDVTLPPTAGQPSSEQSSQESPTRTEFFASRRELNQLFNLANRILHQQLNNTTDSVRQEFFRGIKDSLSHAFNETEQTLSLTEGRIRIRVPSGFTIEMREEAVNQSFRRLLQIHDSLNYGGNIEASPPLPEAQFGKIVVGSFETVGGGEAMDTDILRILQAQRIQPLVKLFTGWLDVAHIDEILAFVPNRSATSSFAIFRSSSGLAIKILEEAALLHLNGLPFEHPQRVTGGEPKTLLTRRTHEGSVPVTQMLRGKSWLHHEPAESIVALEPPRIYIKLAEFFSGNVNISAHDVPFRPGPGNDRYYPANINIFEFLHFEEGTNQEIENNILLSNIDPVLNDQFANIPIFKIPVLFDMVFNFQEQTTTAFTPNLINLQVIGNQLLIPRPFGPRMKVDHAIEVLKKVFEQREFSVSGALSRLTAPFVRNKRLLFIPLWVKETSLGYLAEQFREGFPDLNLSEIEERILHANRRHFDRRGGLRAGWRKVLIPEETVDLFEFYTEIVADILNLQVRWIDSWFYHVRLGEIHCGTNVVRRPNIRPNQAWWQLRQFS